MGNIFKYLTLLAPIANIISAFDKHSEPGQSVELRPSYQGRKFSILITRTA